MKVHLHLVAQEYVCNRMYYLSLCHAVCLLWGLVKQTEKSVSRDIPHMSTFQESYYKFIVIDSS